MNLNEILNQIDVVELGEILMNKAESILYSDYNIIVHPLSIRLLKGNPFVCNCVDLLNKSNSQVD